MDELNQRQKYIITAEDIQRVFSVILDSPPAPLSYEWKAFKSWGLRAACSALALALESEHEMLTPDKAIAKLPSNIPPALASLARDRVEFRRALEQLRGEEWLEVSSRGMYRFRMDLFRCWLRRYHTVWTVDADVGNTEAN